jgi:hypothetical protein
VKYANVVFSGGAIQIAAVLPLTAVPDWDPQSPCPGTCPVPDEAQPGWTRDPAAPGGWAPPPPPTIAETQELHAAAVQARLDAFAQERGYDGILAACSYATSTNETYRADAETCTALRDATWTDFYAVMAAVQGGAAEMPTPEALEALLPTPKWGPNEQSQ